MTMKLSLYLGVMSVVLGVIFLFTPIESAAGIDCGNVFGGGAVESTSSFGDEAPAPCGPAKGERWMLILAFAGLGVAAALAAVDYQNGLARQKTQDDATPTT